MAKTTRTTADKAGPKSARARAPMPVGRIVHETMQKRVYDELKDAFLNSRFLPGQTLTMRGLAETVGTSVQPVREALQRLCAEGALEGLPNKAFRVPEIDAARYAELWALRKLLEGQAARNAAKHMSPALLRELRDINDEMRASMRKGDAETTLRLNREFHFTIYRASESPLLVWVIEMIWVQVSPLFAAFTRHELGQEQTALDERLPAAAEDFFVLQDAVIEALSRGRPENAGRAIEGVLDLSANLFQSAPPKKKAGGRK